MPHARPPGLPASFPPSFEELYAVAHRHLPERLRLLRVPAEDVGEPAPETVLPLWRVLDSLCAGRLEMCRPASRPADRATSQAAPRTASRSLSTSPSSENEPASARM